MSQSEWLGAILIAGFLVWLAMNKRLSVYWSILTGHAAAAAPALTVLPQPNANMPTPAPAPSTAAPAPPTSSSPSSPNIFGLPFSLKGTPFCVLGGTLCN